MLTDRPQTQPEQLIPDPWELPTAPSEDSPAEVPSHAITTPEPLLLADPQPHADRILLQDWLKLKVDRAKQLAQKLQEALGFLYWLENQA